jgi:hypothetical protein
VRPLKQAASVVSVANSVRHDKQVEEDLWYVTESGSLQYSLREF